MHRPESQFIQYLLHLFVQSAELLFSGVGWDPDWWCIQDDGRRERKRDLEFVPAPELNFALHGNVKAQDGGSRFVRKQHRTLFCDVARAARTINRKRRIFSLPEYLD